MQIHTNLIYTGSGGRKSPFDLYLTDQARESTLVVFAHGYKGFKDWGAWHLVAESFANAGFNFLKFNFSHNGGTVKDPIDFPDLEAFSKNTYSRELEDLSIISDLIRKGIKIDGKTHSWNQYALIGHSRGGGMVILHAARDKAVSHLATWAGVADFGERFKFDLESWKRDGVTYVLNGRTKQNMPHKYTYYQDFIDNEAELKIESSAKRIAIPWLIAHGTKDEAVAYDHAERLHSWNPESVLYPTTGIGHTFGAIHPWPKMELPQASERVASRTIEFFQQ